MLQEAIFTTESPRVRRHQTNSYNDWLRQKIEVARVYVRAGQGIPNEEIEAEFVAKRQQLMSEAGSV